MTSIAVSPFDSRRVLVGGDMLGAALSTDRGETWQRTSGFKSWEMADFTWSLSDPAIVWAGTMSGPYRSSDGGRTWQEMRGGFPPVSDGSYSAPIQKILFDPNDVHHLLAFGGSHRRWGSPGTPLWGAVWESVDDGGNWTRIATITDAAGKPANVLAASFAAHSSLQLYAAVDRVGLLVSFNGGRTWTPRNAGLPHADVEGLAVHPAKPGTLWIALGCRQGSDGTAYLPGGIYRSDDAGATWTAGGGLSAKRSNDPNLTANYRAVVVSPSDPDILLTSNAAWDGADLSISIDGGLTWRSCADKARIATPMPSGLNMTCLAFDPTSSKTAFAAGAEYMIRTIDGGHAWTDVIVKPVGQQAGKTFWRGRGYAGWVCTNFVFDPSNPFRSAFLGCDHANFWQSVDGFRSWTWGGPGLPSWGGSYDAAFAGPGTIYVILGQAGTFDGIARSADGGQTWIVQNGSAKGLPNRGTRTPKCSIYAASATDAWACVSGNLYRTTDGERWRLVDDGHELTGIAVCPNAAGTMYLAGKAGVYRSSGNGMLELIPDSPKNVNAIAVDARGRVLVTAWCSRPGGLWRFDGATWLHLRDDSFIAAVAADPASPVRIAVATDDHPYHDHCAAAGISVSDDDGATWHAANDGLTCLRGPVLVFNPHDPKQLIFGSAGSGFFVGKWQ